jgi:hypothetical protein
MTTNPDHARDRVVYLIGNADNRLVKIGTTTRNSLERLNGIQTMSPSILTVLWTTPGGRELEHKLHYRFREERRHGEWFDFGDCDPLAEVRAAAAELAPPDMARMPDAPPASDSPFALIDNLDRAADSLGAVVAEDLSWTPADLAACLDAVGCAMRKLRITLGIFRAAIDESALSWDADLAPVEASRSSIEAARAGLATVALEMRSAAAVLDVLAETVPPMIEPAD